MKRTKLRGMKCDTAVVLGNAGTAGGVLTRALQDEEPLVREHAAWASGQLARRGLGEPAL